MRKSIFLFLFLAPLFSVKAQQVDSIIDIRDDQVYKLVKIGQQWWMQENLNTGTRINSSQDAADNGVIEKYCYSDLESNCDIYGGLYRWEEMMDYNPSDNGNPGITRGICPAGWHLPTDNEWTELTDFLVGESVAGGKLKETGIIHWKDPNTGATNESGFTGLPGGYRYHDKGFYGVGDNAYFWSSAEDNGTTEWFRRLDYDNSEMNRYNTSKGFSFFSVRCLRDSSQFGYLTISEKNLGAISKLDFIDNRIIDTIIIINSAPGNTINITSIHTATSVYNLTESSADLIPGDSIHLYVAFNPPITGIYYFDTLRIESNDPYRPVISVPLMGYMPETDSIVDIRDDQIYKIVKIGQQWWMKENLNIGTRINGVQDAVDNGVIEKYCYDDNTNNCKTYGGLYQWSEMMKYSPSDNENPGKTQGICPAGWHLPSDNEWTELVDYLGGESVAGGKLKENGTTHWLNPNTGATNESGFTALPGGRRDYYEIFISNPIQANWWSSTESSTTNAWNLALTYDRSDVYRGNINKKDGYSVRCLRDSSQFGYLTISDINLDTVSKLDFTDEQAIDTIIMINTSAGKTINVTSIHTNTSAYNPNKTSASLLPGDSIHLKVIFNPPIKGKYYYDTLLIESDDPYNPIITIPLNGYMKTDTIIDIRDGQIYSVVKIGRQWWMQENLNIGTHINGSLNAADNGIIEKYCYSNDTNNCKIYGGLYHWNETMDYNPSDNGNPGITRGICPVGWYLPTINEWTELINYLGGISVAAGKLKETGTTYWMNPNTGATNESGFTALPDGYRMENGNFYGLGKEAYFWSSTEFDSFSAWPRYLNFEASYMGLDYNYKVNGYSVRCLRDSCQFDYLTISDENFRTVSGMNFYGANIIEELILINPSAGKAINISSIYTKNSAYVLNKSSSALPPGDSIHLTIKFDPPVKDIYPDTLFVKSNDPYDSLIIITLNGTFPPEILFTDSTNISCFGYSDGSATVTPSLGTPPYFYQWDDEGNTTDSNVTGLEANIYYHVTITDSLGWTITDSIILSQPLLLTSEITDSSNISCFGFSDGEAVITPSGGTIPYSFAWDDPAGTTDSTATDLAANQYYHVTINDANGCTFKDSVMLSEPAVLLSSVTDSSNISCHGYSDGSATIKVTGGTRPYAYLWDNQGATADSVVTGLSANQRYHVSINDVHGCSVTDSVMLSQPDPLAIDITDSTNISCYNVPNGIARVTASGGTKPYFYSWDNPDNSIDSLGTGLFANIYYHVTVTDAHSCPEVADSVILSQPTLLVIDITDSTNISCHGFSDGTATVTTSGGTPPYNYQWDDPGNTTDSSVTGLSANIYYYVEATDDYGCSTTDNIILSEPDPLEINPLYSDTICLNSSNGFIKLNPSGGTPSYSYAWSGGETSQNLSNLPAGHCSVKVTDSHGCIDSADFIIHPAVPCGGEQICIVTIDMLTGKNLIIWEKTAGKGIEFYKIYREGNVIGTLSFNELSIFVDSVADPEKRSYLYKISVIDTCGNESKLSPYHKPIFLQYISSDKGVMLTWSKYEIEGQILNFDSYTIYRGSDSTALSPFEADIPKEIDSYTDNDPNALKRKYYYRVAGILTDPCIPTGAAGKKADSGPYSHSMSNIEDNRLQETPEGVPRFSENEFRIIPNPFNETTTLMFSNPEGHAYTLYIMDLSGKVCRIVENINTSEYVLKKEGLKEGFYFVELRGLRLLRGRMVIE